jgi:hypothetical protein
MEFLFSNYPPLKTNSKCFADKFDELIFKCDEIRIASGYITADSIAELKKIIEYNSKPKLELVIGMHYFSGFSKIEYQASQFLNDFLVSNNLGKVYISTAFKYHGKIYSFTKNATPFAGIVGSNNLGSITEFSRIYESGIVIDNAQDNLHLSGFIKKLIAISSPFDKCDINKFNEYNSLLENHECVEKVNNFTQIDKSAISFRIPLKVGSDHLKSNLNCYFGKGRVDRRGLIKPRHWYEIELIVPKEITEKSQYPKAKSRDSIINVITDDGWKFKCKVSGDYSKNFRSEGDLKILGKWIKGRLENAGALKIGSPVTEDTLKKYGRDSFDLIKSKQSDLWYLDFGVIK